MKSFIAPTIENLIAGFRLALLLPIRRDRFRPGLAVSFATLAIGVVVLASFSYGRQEGEIYFNDMGAAFLGTAILAIIVIAMVVTRVYGTLDRLPDLLTLLFAAFPWVAVVLSGVGLILNPAANNSAHWLMALLWCVTIVARSVQLTFRRASARSLLLIALVTASFAYAAAYRGHAPVLFYSYDSSEFDDYALFNQEELYFSQSRLLADALDQVRPGRPEQTDVYFIGFAGNGNEPVFASEVKFAQQRVAEKFETGGRSLAFASNAGNIDSKPLANTHNLFRSIADLGAKMDVEQDVLFLFLTSHGSKDASVDVSLFPLQLKQLSANDLRTALDVAGIQWRIVVVSACYSGSFIEPLITDRTIVMTASAAENTSFGCSRDRDLTYFGEAFFQLSFEGDGNLVDVFDRAKAAIDEREATEGLSPSDPQIYVGPEMAQKISELAATE